jgi:hypothetical protein
MKKIFLKTLWVFGLLFLTIALVYAVANDRKSSKLPWQGVPNWFYDSTHNVGTSYESEVRFSLTGSNYVVYDEITGLYWQSAWTNWKTLKWATDYTYKEPTWDDSGKVYKYPSWRTKANYPAFEFCEDSTTWWYTDWRLPTYRELSSILDFSSQNGINIDTHYFSFGNTITGLFWSSTTDVNNPYDAWYVSFQEGGGWFYNVKSYSRQVRCVR